MGRRVAPIPSLAQAANGQIVQHVQTNEDGTGTHFFEWKGGPLAFIHRDLWDRMDPAIGVRIRPTRVRIGPFDLLLMEDNPYLPYELWYRMPEPTSRATFWSAAEVVA